MAKVGFSIPPGEIVDRMRAAAMAAGLDGVQEGIQNLKDDLIDAAPRGSQRRLANGGSRPGGRTADGIGIALDRGVGTSSSTVFEAEVVMPPQGFYVNDGVSAKQIRATRAKALSFEWDHQGPQGAAGWAIVPRNGPGFGRQAIDSTFGKTTVFGKGHVDRKASTGTGWIDQIMGQLESKVTSSEARGKATLTFVKIMRRKNFIALASDVGNDAFDYSASSASWRTPYPSSDASYRRRAEGQAREASAKWTTIVGSAIRRSR